MVFFSSTDTETRTHFKKVSPIDHLDSVVVSLSLAWQERRGTSAEGSERGEWDTQDSTPWANTYE